MNLENGESKELDLTGDCFSCRFRNKCKMLNTAMEIMTRLEVEFASEYRIDVETEIQIKYCPHYVQDPEADGLYIEEDN